MKLAKSVGQPLGGLKKGVGERNGYCAVLRPMCSIFTVEGEGVGLPHFVVRSVFSLPWIRLPFFSFR